MKKIKKDHEKVLATFKSEKMDLNFNKNLLELRLAENKDIWKTFGKHLENIWKIFGKHFLFMKIIEKLVLKKMENLILNI